MYNIDEKTSIYLFKDSVLCRLIYEGSFEQDEIAFVKEHLKNGDIFLDIGSNIGLFSLIASNLVGPSGKIIALEPSPYTFKRLELNLSLATINNIELKNIGLSDSIGKLKLNISGSGYDAWDSFASEHESKSTNTVEVQVSTLDDQLVNIDKNKISLVKIDVEGWEKYVLLGGESFFKKYSPTLLVEFTEKNTKAAGYEVTQIYDLLVEWGYEWYTYKNGKLIPSRRKLSYPDENLIALKKAN